MKRHDKDENKELIRIILYLAKEHKERCDGTCNISLFPLRQLIRDLGGRGLMEEESEILI